MLLLSHEKRTPWAERLKNPSTGNTHTAAPPCALLLKNQQIDFDSRFFHLIPPKWKKSKAVSVNTIWTLQISYHAVGQDIQYFRQNERIATALAFKSKTTCGKYCECVLSTLKSASLTIPLSNWRRVIFGRKLQLILLSLFGSALSHLYYCIALQQSVLSCDNQRQSHFLCSAIG